ncbi:hypothetical protein YPPY10_1779, partial [Yersinia pestis PY-10]
MPAQFTATSNE